MYITLMAAGLIRMGKGLGFIAPLVQPVIRDGEKHGHMGAE